MYFLVADRLVSHINSYFLLILRKRCFNLSSFHFKVLLPFLSLSFRQVAFSSSFHVFILFLPSLPLTPFGFSFSSYSVLSLHNVFSLADSPFLFLYLLSLSLFLTSFSKHFFTLQVLSLFLSCSLSLPLPFCQYNENVSS